jgi:hypothetical protein
MQMIRQILIYLGERQTPTVRFLHVTILLLVLSQLLVSNFMGFGKNGVIVSHGVQHYFTWIHIAVGFSLLPITLLFVFVELRCHGLRYFFPYLAQLREDIGELKKLRLPEPKAGGLAVIVQGLGLCALLIVILSGSAWFVFWEWQVPWMHAAMELHKLLTGLVITYLIGHGGMGALHILLHLIKVRKEGSSSSPHPR